MKVLFIDTDVIIDLLSDRQPFSKDAAGIFSLIERREVRGCVSALSFSNLYYILNRFSSHGKVISMLNELADLTDILKVDSRIIKSALASGFKDFEDAIQYQAALEHKNVDVLITRNINDYRKSSLPVMTPETFLRSL